MIIVTVIIIITVMPIIFIVDDEMLAHVPPAVAVRCAAAVNAPQLLMRSNSNSYENLKV